jgi:REP-associated tyrosine transposase
MPYGLKRFQQSAQSHFVTFTCYHRRRGFHSPAVYDLFVQVLEEMRCRFALCVYGYVVMPEHVHLLLSEPPRGLLADAMHYLKLSFAKRLVAQVRAPLLGANLGHPSGVFWQKRYYDRNVRDEREFVEKLRYIHRNPVKAGFCELPKIGRGAAFVTMHCEKKESWKSSQSGRRAIGRGKRQAAGRGYC